MLFRTIVLLQFIMDACTVCIAASIPQRMATPHCRGSYQTPEIGRSLRDRDSISLEAGSLERRLDSQEIRNRKWAEQLNEPWLDFCPDDCEGFGQNSDYFREDISKKIVKRVPLSNTGASRNIFTLPRDSKYKVDSSGKTYKGDDIALKFVDLSKRNAACEVVSLQYFEYFIDAGIVKDDPGTGVIVMKKQPGKPLHKIKVWQEAPLKQKLAIYHKVQSTVCSKIYDWIQRRELLYSDFTPLNILVILNGKGELIRLKSVKIVDFGPPGVVETKYTPTPQVFEQFFSARWDFLWEPLVVIPEKEKPRSACPALIQ
ncbi:uncharacterized protein C8R40DRAFT_1102763 [Lentinula edodes]|uniref:uncharacterized protein n=1 Tax=Lentinula edodes TaxID=5353 RepID=UPI001E8CE503|nr:uncharacterized protein C8R40DRAFT_1102763 [Lentinula edodes]KAH7875657.1 hypothetical protein C8R40DRAFT_1102763 [Lentinula edodes]